MIIIISVLIFTIIVLTALLMKHIININGKNSFIHLTFKDNMGKLNLPIVTFKNNGQEFNFLLDTGATVSIVDSKALKNMQYSKLDVVGTAYGIDGNIVDTDYVNMELECEGYSYIENFQVMRMNAFDNVEETEGIVIIGILGSGFMKRYGFFIDFTELLVKHKIDNKHIIK